MPESTIRSAYNNCFVCGPENAHGLRLAFRLDGDICRAEFTPPEYYCGYAGVIHGGIIYSLLDDVMANWLFIRGERAYTARCDVRYRAPVATGSRILLAGELISRRRRFAQMAGRASGEDGQIFAEATATFAIMDIESA